MRTVIIAYIPVIHRGYIEFICRHPEADTVYILDADLLTQFEWLRKDIRALSPAAVVTGLAAVLSKEGSMATVQLLDQKGLDKLAEEELQLILPDEEIMHNLVEKFFAKVKISYDTVFLRWDNQYTLQQKPVVPDTHQSLNQFQQKVMATANQLAEKSADWWRQVGAVIVQEGEIVLAGFNQHVPDQYQPLYNGDPRGNFKKGLHIELTTAFHAEAALIAAAAKKGIKLEGAEMYVTTFPCPHCAKSIAYSGIKKLYFQGGYSLVDGESILKEKGVEIIQLT